MFRVYVLGYTLFWFISKWTFEKWDQPGSYTLTVSTLVFILFSLYMLYRLVSRKDSSGEPIRGNFQFWVTSGILLYFAGSAIEFLMLSLIVNLSREAFFNIWSIHWSINVVVNICFAFGFLCLKRPQMA